MTLFGVLGIVVLILLRDHVRFLRRVAAGVHISFDLVRSGHVPLMYASTAQMSSSDSRPPNAGMSLIPRRRVRFDAALHDIEQQCIGVMPRVAGRIMRRRREFAARETLAPIRLPLETCPMAGRTVLAIHSFSDRDLLRIRWIGLRLLSARRPGERERNGQCREIHGPPEGQGVVEGHSMYVVVHDLPKLAQLRTRFPALYQ